MRNSNSIHWTTPWTLGLGFALAVLVGWPLTRLALEWLGSPGATIVLLESANVRALGNTVALTLGVLGFAAGFGVPLGFLIGRTDLPGAHAWRMVCTLPYVVPPYITAIAWIALLNPTTGLLNRAAAPLGIGPFDIYSLPGMIFVMGLEAAPFVMLATADGLLRMDASLEEQARIAGATPWQTLRHVTVPMVRPALFTAASFVVASTTAAFGVPYLLASGRANPDFVLTTRIYQALDLDPATGRPIAVALSAVLLALGVGLPALLGRLRGGGRFTTVSGKATRPSPFRLGRARIPALLFIGFYALIGAGLPLVTLLVTSLMQNFGRGFTTENLTFANYIAVLWTRSDTLPALLRSLWLAGAAATVATVLGAVVAWIQKRQPSRTRRLLVEAARLPYAIPGTVLALGLVLAWSQEIRFILLDRLTLALALADTLWLLGLAYTVKFLAFPVGQAQAGLESMDAGLEEAARISGAGPATVLRSVTGPLLRPNLVSAWFLVFFPAFTEVTLSILLAGPETRVIGTLLFDLQTYGDPPAAAVLAVVVTALVLAGQAGLRVLSRRSEGA